MVIGRTAENPLVCASVICAAVLYFGFPLKNRNEFSSLVQPSAVVFMRGKIVSNPAKLPKQQKYVLKFEPAYVKTSGGITSTCSGVLTVMLDSTMAEAYLPGSLYSLSRRTGALVGETGALAEFSGKAGTDGIFFADKGRFCGFPDTPGGRIAHIRALCRIQFRRLMYAWGAAGGLLLALLSGIREYTESITADAFRDAGVAHILALSGMHLSILSGLAVTGGNRLYGKKAAYVFQLSAILIFVWFAGFSPSLFRAFLCSISMIVLSVCGITDVSMLHVLCAAFLCHIVAAPSDCTSAAFILSYGALAGILVFGELINGLLVHILPQCISSKIAASAAAQSFTAPASLKLFGTFMPGGIAASVVVSPLVTLFMYAGLFCIVLCLLFPVCTVPAGTVMNSIYAAVKVLVTAFARIPGITVHHVI
jgi:competence protein ComEC